MPKSDQVPDPDPLIRIGLDPDLVLIELAGLVSVSDLECLS
jgi:hypothetical protein